MAKLSIFCIATSRSQAEKIIISLKDEGFSTHDISALFADNEMTGAFAQATGTGTGTKAAQGAFAGASGGAVLGGGLGWLVSVGALAIPGAGPFVAAGPLFAALSGAAMGGAVGGLGGALVGMGIPETEAKSFEGKLAAGNILISVHSHDPEEIRLARDLFEEFEAQDISTSHESSPNENREAIWGPRYQVKFMH